MLFVKATERLRDRFDCQATLQEVVERQDRTSPLLIPRHDGFDQGVNVRPNVKEHKTVTYRISSAARKGPFYSHET